LTTPAALAQALTIIIVKRTTGGVKCCTIISLYKLYRLFAADVDKLMRKFGAAFRGNLGNSALEALMYSHQA